MFFKSKNTYEGDPAEESDNQSLQNLHIKTNSNFNDFYRNFEQNVLVSISPKQVAIEQSILEPNPQSPSVQNNKRASVRPLEKSVRLSRQSVFKRESRVQVDQTKLIEFMHSQTNIAAEQPATLSVMVSSRNVPKASSNWKEAYKKNYTQKINTEQKNESESKVYKDVADLILPLDFKFKMLENNKFQDDDLCNTQSKMNWQQLPELRCSLLIECQFPSYILS